MKVPRLHFKEIEKADLHSLKKTQESFKGKEPALAAAEDGGATAKVE